ncbi:polyketide synthase PksB [Xylaria bambusicola]|uniref:polyketide synthase PksB n=1 Tax=Xylaria bambusicola TaxID=326684 RepID=UPI0020075C05|nr:polyketide synthase PksB [Xylaria bambusicola]KAI0520879.1 polyketide synthase PksB [Xylaria bambusicola]
MPTIQEPIAVVGSGCRFPGGSNTPSKLWELLQNPRDLSTKVPNSRFNVDKFYHPEATHHGTTNATKSYFLEQDISQFDAGFFNIQPLESEAIDPQQRLLLETVYDSLCSAGMKMEKLRGSSTAVYVGMMCDDWSTMVSSDLEALPTYAATGTSRAVMSNRVSYCFDWHGPSMTIDTACSSSLVAVHHAVQALRNGESQVAVAAGTNLILSPNMYISETNLRMLSPTGRCAMWDVKADGYARGEGIAAIVLKTLRQALADGDPIECVIRETGVNQDGRTTGLTMPSNLAQAALIRDTYRRAGLDIRKSQDRPQFFHAHGTGTQAGDPQEAQAIESSLFPTDFETDQKLYVGSIKTIIGHTEGCAGLASLIGTSLAMQNGVIPPNLHFSSLSPKVEPFYKNLHIPTNAIPWPKLSPGQVRRASINSFGFGGTNAHAIVEAYESPKPSLDHYTTPALFTPLTFSAASEKALLNMLSDHSAHLRCNPDMKLEDLAWTLQEHRSTLPYRKAIAGANLDTLLNKLASFENSTTSEHPELSARQSSFSHTPLVLGVFTGQGAQWPRMGATLVESSPFAKRRIAELDEALQSLPEEDRPSWTILHELLADAETSRIGEAALSQPLCTAVQILLVDILQTACIRFTAVVGHSSGEIGAAYAAGLLSATDAIRIAYYRGLYAKLAASPNGSKGSMMAVSMSHEDAVAFCQQETFFGRIAVAAVNSSSSVTLSGDMDAIDEAYSHFKQKEVFARKLKVDTAYHSAHMLTCSEPYLNSMKEMLIQPGTFTGPVWFSSVMDGVQMSANTLDESYWVDNMCSPVLFSSALAKAVSTYGQFDLAIEVGPHPALKGPATANLEELGFTVPYTGVLSRGQSDVEELANFLGFLWTRLGPDQVKLAAVQSLLSESSAPYGILAGLPAYPFDHHRSYWTSSRISNSHKNRKESPNPILGTLCTMATTTKEVQWRNFLHPSEISWLKGHKLQGQTVFPATGYVSMAIEAMNFLAGQDEISYFKISDLDINRAISINDDGAGIETIFSVSSISREEHVITAQFACHTLLPSDQTPVLHAQGYATVHLGAARADVLPGFSTNAYNLVDVDITRFYADLNRIGYEYSPPFQGVSLIRRKPEYSTGLLIDQSDSNWEDNVLAHPGMLDSALQTAFAAVSFPGDGQLWSLHIPTHVTSIVVNPYFTPMALGKQKTMKYDALVRARYGSSMEADIHLTTEYSGHSFVKFEGVKLVPFSPASAANDVPMFSSFQYCLASPDGIAVAEEDSLSEKDAELYKNISRIAFWHVHNTAHAIKERGNLLPHYQHYLRWCDCVVDLVSRGEHMVVFPEAMSDTRAHISAIVDKYKGRSDVRCIQTVGDHLVEVIQAGTSIQDHVNQDDLLSTFYDNEYTAKSYRWLAHIAAQIAKRYPSIHILEIGARAGAATESILSTLGNSFSSYTFTDSTPENLLVAEKRFEKFSNRMIYKAFDMEKPPTEQGFSEQHYDVIIAANVLHTSSDVESSLAHIRRLLKPGGYLLTLELTNSEHLLSGMTIGTLPGPWDSALTLNEWSHVLEQTGFSGIDSITPDTSSFLPFAVFVSQAIDDRVSLLRDPMTASYQLGARTGSLAIIGGSTLPVYQLVEEITAHLAPLSSEVTVFETLEEMSRAQGTLAQGMSILCLTDLDEPYMKNNSQEKFESLKCLWRIGGSIVWVTRNARSGEPYSYMMMGVGRAIKTEYPNINLQMLDIDTLDNGTSLLLTEAFIRHYLLTSWGEDAARILWSIEPEISIQDGRAMISRILPNQEKNDRYNSQRRTIYRDINAAVGTVRLVGSDNACELQHISPLRQPASARADCRTIRITHSLLKSIKIDSVGFFRLCAGFDIDNGEPVVALSSSDESPAVIPSKWCVKREIGSLELVELEELLVTLAAYFIADSITNLVFGGDAILIHEPDVAIIPTVQLLAREKNVEPYFTTAYPSSHEDVIFFHPESSRSNVQDTLPASIGAMVSFVGGRDSTATQRLIATCLPARCMSVSISSFLSNEAQSLPSIDPETVSRALFRAWVYHSKTTQASPSKLPHPKGISMGSESEEPFAIFDWTAPSISAKVLPIDTGILFKSDKTYWLTGMAGELGQSLSAWMVSHGARNIVLSSRNPKVNPKFIEDMKRRGANVKTLSLDVTSRRSLYKCHKEIVKTMPEIAGVMNGAMILQDGLFDTMTYEQFQKVIRPKVEGTKLLDELFYSTPLDFFIVTSSITAITGLTGQSNYSAANTFMTAMMYQRKKRGVAGSSMDIPAVAGVGYAAQGDNFDFGYFSSIGYITISEHDFRTLFAEAIISGRPNCPEQAEVITGVNYVPVDVQVKEAHRRDVKFSHFIIKEDHNATPGTGKVALRVKAQLQQAKTKEDVSTIVQEAFLMKLKRVLQTADGDAVDDSVALVEQGVDSLVAVEIRSWFLKEVEVDIPVLKVLGGSSISDLIATAVDKIPETLVNLSNPDSRKPGLPTTSSPPPSIASIQQSPSVQHVKSTVLSAAENNENIHPPARTVVSRSITATTASSLGTTPVFTPNLSPTLTPSSAMSNATPSSSESSPLLKPHDIGDDKQSIIISLPSLSNLKATAEMSYGQTRFWFLHQLLKDKTPFNFSICACMKGPFNLGTFERAVNLVMQRHEAFQTTFFWAAGDSGIPTQGISYRPLIELEKGQITSEAEAMEELQRLRDHTYDLENGGAVLMKLLSLSEHVHYFLVGCHHIAMDGQSMHIFMSEVDRTYRNQRLEPMLPESQYRAFSAHQRHQHESGRMKPDIEYFRKIITEDPTPIELFPFSKLKARKVMTTYRLNKAEMSVDIQTARVIKQLARKLHCTNFHVYLTVLQALIFRLLPENDQVFVGIADSNRVDSKFIGTLGCLVNLLPIRFDRGDDTKFGDAVKSSRNKVYGALEHSQVPFDVLLDALEISRSGEHTPIFQIFMDYRLSEQQKTVFAGCDTEVTWNNASTGYDLQLEVLDTNAGETLITLKLQDALYSQYHTELLLRTYVHVLKQFTADGVGDITLDKPTVWSQQDIDIALTVAKGPSLSLSWPPTISHRIDQVIKLYPSVTAIKDSYENVLTYADLADRMNTIARELKKLGVGEGTVVAVFQEPSADWMCSMLAIFRTGATYIPLDLKNGIDRLVGSINVARPHAILVDRWTAIKAPELQLSGELIINVSKIRTVEACPEVRNAAKEDSTAVVLFTSGSTGVPKGIKLPHSCFAAHAEGIETAWGVGPNVVLQQITLSFDLSLHQIFTALANGGTLCVVPSHKRGDPEAITQLMLDESVSYTIATPTEYNMWHHESAANLSQCTAWRWALTGGEVLPKTTIRDFAKLALPSLKLYDVYGPAEATIAITKSEIRYNEVGLEQVLPTGHMLPNYSLYILDEQMKPAPVGVSGEIVVGGPGVAAGYLGLEELTAEKFIKNPFDTVQPINTKQNRLYRTGDRGYLGEDGALYFEGRIDGDTQIKLRGIRIELGEIEAAIMNTAGGAISQSVIAAHGEDESKFLVAYIVFSSQHHITNPQGWLTNLQSNLPVPPYMQPSQFIVLQSMPMNSHGKIDRKALRSIPVEYLNSSQGASSTTNLNETEKLVAEQWQKILPSRGISLRPETNFFHVGGNSLLLVKLQRLLKESFDSAPRLVDLMTSSTLKEMSDAVDKISCTSKIDWRSDTLIPASWATSPKSLIPPGKENLTILLTGATGYLGRHVLPRLIEDSRVSKVICLVRDESGLQEHDKIEILVCKLSEDNLGLPSDVYERLAKTSDIVIHCAANRSFWDDYEALRQINVLSVKQLIHLASFRQLPLHFFSSGAAAPVTTDGYLLSKFAAEKLLENASSQLNIPVYIHTPQAAPPDAEPTSDQAVISAFVECARQVGARPGFDGFRGYIDLLETGDFIDQVVDTVFHQDAKADLLTRVPYSGMARADINSSTLARFAEHAEWLELPTMDPLLWMGEAKRAGFPYVLVAQNLIMSSGSGQVVSKR